MSEIDDNFQQIRLQLLRTAKRRFQLDPSSAEDVVQQTISIFLTKFPHITDSAEAMRVGWPTIRFTFLEEYRKINRNLPMPEHDFMSREMPLDEALDKRRRYEALEAAILALDGKCRAAVTMRLEEQTTEAIAAALNMSTATLAVHEFRCRKKLRDLLEGN